MKRLFLFTAIVIAAIAGTVCYNHDSDNELSETAKANIKALADNRDDNEACEKKKGATCMEWIVKPGGLAGAIYYPDYINRMEII